MEKLSKYIKDNGSTLRAFARSVDISPSYLCELLLEDEQKRKSPSLEVALRIQKGTAGKVTIADWPKLAKIGRAFQNIPSNDAPLTEASS